MGRGRGREAGAKASGEDVGDTDQGLEWIEGPPPARGRRQRLVGGGIAALCVVLTFVGLLAAQLHTAASRSSTSGAFANAGTVEVQTNVPWAVLQVDAGPRSHLLSGSLGSPGVAGPEREGQVPELSVSLAPGRHALVLTAAGFATRRQTITLAPHQALAVELLLTLTDAGRTGMLAGLDDLLGSLPTRDLAGGTWLAAHGMVAFPADTVTLVRFHAAGLASSTPLFLRPESTLEPPPLPLALGAAVAVTVEVSVFDRHTGQLIVRKSFVCSPGAAMDASILFLDGRWVGAEPFLHNSATPVTAQALLALIQ